MMPTIKSSLYLLGYKYKIDIPISDGLASQTFSVKMKRGSYKSL